MSSSSTHLTARAVNPRRMGHPTACGLLPAVCGGMQGMSFLLLSPSQLHRLLKHCLCRSWRLHSGKQDGANSPAMSQWIWCCAGLESC